MCTVALSLITLLCSMYMPFAVCMYRVIILVISNATRSISYVICVEDNGLVWWVQQHASISGTQQSRFAQVVPRCSYVRSSYVHTWTRTLDRVSPIRIAPMWHFRQRVNVPSIHVFAGRTQVGIYWRTWSLEFPFCSLVFLSTMHHVVTVGCCHAHECSQQRRARFTSISRSLAKVYHVLSVLARLLSS